MKTASIRELKHNTRHVLTWVSGGETVEVLRRNQLVAILSPPPSAQAAPIPNYVRRLRAIYGDERLKHTGTTVVAEARGET